MRGWKIAAGNRPPTRSVAPLGLEAVLAQRLELGPKLVALLLVGGEAEAAGAAERVARQAGEPVE